MGLLSQMLRLRRVRSDTSLRDTSRLSWGTSSTSSKVSARGKEAPTSCRPRAPAGRARRLISGVLRQAKDLE